MWWEILEVDRDASKKDIKRAYARKIKDAYGNDDQEVIMSIQNAYKIATKHIEYMEAEEEEENGHYIWNNVDIHYEKIENDEQSKNRVIQHLDEVYRNLDRRFKEEEWINIFNDLSLAEEEIATEVAVDFFNENYQLPNSIWIILDELFELTNSYDFKWSEKVFYSDWFEYGNINGISYSELESFYEKRSQAYEWFLQCDYEKVIEICLSITKMQQNIDSASIEKMKGISYFELKEYELSLISFEKLKNCQGRQAEANRFIAEVLIEQGDKVKGIEILESNEGDVKLLNERKIVLTKGESRSRLWRFINYGEYLGNSENDFLVGYKNALKIEKLLYGTRLVGKNFDITVPLRNILFTKEGRRITKKVILYIVFVLSVYITITNLESVEAQSTVFFVSMIILVFNFLRSVGRRLSGNNGYY